MLKPKSHDTEGKKSEKRKGAEGREGEGGGRKDSSVPSKYMRDGGYRTVKIFLIYSKTLGRTVNIQLIARS